MSSLPKLRMCFALALGVLVAACSESSPNRFEILRDQQGETYDETSTRLTEQDSELMLFASNLRDPIPDAADDESSDSLRVMFDANALGQIVTDQDYPISGQASWDTMDGGVPPDEVTFTPEDPHTDAVQYVLFQHQCFGCYFGQETGTQVVRGTMRLTVIEVGRLAGAIQLRVEGDVPGIRDNAHTWDLVLVFDQRYGDTGADAGTDAGTDAGV